MEKGKFDSPPALNPLTDFRHNLHRWLRRDVYHSAKFDPDRIRGFVSTHARPRLRSPNYLMGYFWGSGNHLQPRRPNKLWRKIRQKTRFHARMYLFGVREPKFNIYTPFLSTTANFRPDFVLGNFQPQNSFNICHGRPLSYTRCLPDTARDKIVH